MMPAKRKAQQNATELAEQRYVEKTIAKREDNRKEVTLSGKQQNEGPKAQPPVLTIFECSDFQ